MWRGGLSPFVPVSSTIPSVPSLSSGPTSTRAIRKPLGSEAVEPACTHDPVANEPSLLEDAEVLGDRRPGDRFRREWGEWGAEPASASARPAAARTAYGPGWEAGSGSGGCSGGGAP